MTHKTEFLPGNKLVIIIEEFASEIELNNLVDTVVSTYPDCRIYLEVHKDNYNVINKIRRKGYIESEIFLNIGDQKLWTGFSLNKYTINR